MTDFVPPLRNQNFNFPLLTWFLDAYLHQDFDILYQDDIDALNGFCSDFEDPVPIRIELLAELDGVLAIPEPELDPVLRPLSGYKLGASTHAWLHKIRAHLVSQMEGGSASPTDSTTGEPRDTAGH